MSDSATWHPVGGWAEWPMFEDWTGDDMSDLEDDAELKRELALDAAEDV